MDCSPFQNRTGRIALKVAAALTAFVAAGVMLWLGFGRSGGTSQPEVTLPEYRPVPVPTNRGEDVTGGFQGDVHPELHGQTRLDVSASLTPLGKGRDRIDKNVPKDVYKLFAELKPVTPMQVYTEREFSRLMPQTVQAPGQVWEIGLDDAAAILRQFHPHPNLQLVAFGRRAGPDGAFAVLRAVSPKHLDIVFRIHAEFDLAQNVWLTPACFLGRMIVDRQAGTVEHFRLWVPTDRPLNMHLTVAESIRKGETEPVVFRKIERGDLVNSRRDIVRVERMELAGGNREMADTLEWPESIGMELAEKKLKQAFYAFEKIDWVPWDQAVQLAGAQKRPILAVVLWGALDDQSC